MISILIAALVVLGVALNAGASPQFGFNGRSR